MQLQRARLKPCFQRVPQRGDLRFASAVTDDIVSIAFERDTAVMLPSSPMTHRTHHCFRRLRSDQADIRISFRIISLSVRSSLG
jgi:hypothetical protein